MRKRIGLDLLITGVIFMLINSGCSSSFKYEKYSSKDPDLGITIDYLSGWRLKEQKGAYGSFAQAVFYEPARQDKTINATVAVIVEPSAKVKFIPADIKGMEEDLLAKRMKFTDTRVVSNVQRKIFGQEAKDMELVYRALDKDYGLDAKLVPIQERIIIFEKNNKFYTVKYQNTAEDFSRFQQAFSYIVKSLRFKEK